MGCWGCLLWVVGRLASFGGTLCGLPCFQGVVAAFLFGRPTVGSDGFSTRGACCVCAIGQGCDGSHDFPNERGQLSRHGDLDLLSRLAACGEFASTLMQTVLAAPGDLLHLAAVSFGDGFLSSGEFLADLRRQSIVLGTLVEDPA